MNDPSKVEALFLAALAHGSPAERAAYLDEACKDNPELRREVERLLEAHPKAGSFLDQPAVDRYATRPPAPDDSAGEAPPLRAAGLIPAVSAGERIGPYKLLEQIGQGGMGTVWMAEQREPVKRLVAVKLIKAGMDSRAVLARFEAERQALALMDHPNIARVFDGGTTSAGRPFFAMELVKGLPLTDYCDSRRLSVAQRLDLFVQICAAVQHAHQKGVIHRDLKPSNVLVTEYDGRPVPKVIDFGLAKALNTSLLTDRTLHTAFGTVVGTLLYMAPEQVAVNAFDVDTRADIYALGVILYELLTGTTPLDRKRLSDAAWGEVQRLIREEEPLRPSARLSSSDKLPSLAVNRQTEPKKLTGLVRGELDWIVMKALEKDRSRRYETANGLAMDVHRHLAGEPVLAHPPSAAYRLRKLLRRNKGPVVAACAVALALVVGIVGTTWGLVIAETRRAESQKRLAQVEKANEILGSIFENLDPDAVEKEGKPLQAIMGEQLDQAVQQLEADAVGDPLVVADLQMRLGRALLGLGYADKAIVVLARARDVRQAQLGLDHPDVRKSMNHLATAYQFAGKLDLALPLFEEEFRLSKVSLGHDHADTLTSMSALAAAYQAVGNLDLALPLMEETLKLMKAKLGPDHPKTLHHMNNLATSYRLARRLDLAVPLNEQTVKLLRAKLGPEHPSTLSCMYNLATAYHFAGKQDLALPLFEETLKLMKARLGPDHPRTLLTMSGMGENYRVAGKLDLALPLLEETLPLTKARLGLDHAQTHTCMNNLASCYRDAAKLDLALPLFEETLRLRKAKLGPENPDTIATRDSLILVYHAADKLERIVPLLEESLELRKARLGPGHGDTLTNMLALAAVYLRVEQPEKATPLLTTYLAGIKRQFGPENLNLASTQAMVARDLLQHQQFAPAEPILRECLAIRAKHEPNAWATFAIQSLLGGALLGQQKYADAEPLLVQGYEGMKQRAAKIPKQSQARLTEALERLIELSTATNKPDEVKKWQAERAKYPAAAPKSLEKK